MNALASGQSELAAALEVFWHPVCTAGDLAATGDRPLAVQLLGRAIAVARTASGGVIALADRCVHRSTRLSVGRVEGESVRCAYHGWVFGGDGHCREIPSMPNGPIPERACVPSYEVEERYGLVWLRLNNRAGTVIPAHPAYERVTADPGSMRILVGEPYTWPVAGSRRVENFVDLAHFAWVHDGSLGRRDEPVPLVPTITRAEGEVRFAYDPPEMAVEETAMFGHSEYRMPMPLTVSIEFWLETGAYRHLWMTACPVDMGSCRAFWTVSRDDDLDGDDSGHMAFQALILSEDQPVVSNQVPGEMVLEPGFELSVRTDKVSIEYRRWLSQLVQAAALGSDAVRDALGSSAVLARSASR